MDLSHLPPGSCDRRAHLGDERRYCGHDDAEGALAGGRIEGLKRRYDPLNTMQDRTHILDQGLGEGAWLHLSSDFDHQRITDLVAQPRQRMADSGRRFVQLLRRPHNTTFRHKRLEYTKYIEVETKEIRKYHSK
jgi:hypothetical protein